MGDIYLTTKVVRAWKSDRDGQEGYKIEYPDGYQSWCPEEEFERTSRKLSRTEKELINE